MDPHQIGQQLRAQVQRDHQQGRPLNPRRLQALISDLCGDEQQELLAPLRHLVLSTAFASAAGMDPPFADGRQLQRLNNELEPLFVPSLCARLQPVLQGLLGMPASEGSHTPAAAALAGSLESAAMHTVPARSAGGTALNAVLAFLSGVLLMALAGVGLMAWQRASGDRAAEPGSISTVASPPPAATAAAPEAPSNPSAPEPAATTSAQPAETPAPPSLPPAATPAAGEARPAADRAVASLQQLYAALSAKDFNQARGLYGGAAADQFGPGFFRQFERVSVQDLRVTSQTGSTLNMNGVVTFVWPDGSVQTESRTFSVDTSSDPPLITASEFARVLTPRR